MLHRTFAVALGLLAAASAWAQAPAPPTSSPATAPAPAPGGAPAPPLEKLRVRLTDVVGLVQVRTDEDQPWQPAKVGMELGAGGEFRTGPRSAVRFLIPPDQTITLDRLGTMKVLTAIKQQNKVVTDLGMKYGRTRYDVEAAGAEHDTKIRSPSSTLSVRGTDVVYEDQAPWAPNASSFTGRALFRNAQQQQVPVGGTQFATVTGNQHGPPQEALHQTTSHPQGGFGEQPIDTQLLTAIPLYGGAAILNLGISGDQAGVHGAGFNDRVNAGVPIVEVLEFAVRWTGAAPAVVDLTVVSPRGDTVSNLHLSSATGGRFEPDNTAPVVTGEQGVIWGFNFPVGVYDVTARLRPASGGGQAPATNAQVQVFFDPNHGNPDIDTGWPLLGQLPAAGSQLLTPANPVLHGRVNVPAQPPGGATAAAKR